MRNIVLTVLAATLLFAACTTHNQREKLLQEITQSEKEIFSKEIDATLEESQHLMDLYLAFADEFPQDSLAPEMLFYCASVAARSYQEKFAITLYQRIYDEYPNHALRPTALFCQALVYDDIMNDAEHAKPLYEQFLVMFPDDPDIEYVQQRLEMVGMSPEEWLLHIQQFDDEDIE